MNIPFKYFVFLTCFGVLDVVRAEPKCIHDEIGWFKYHEIPLPWNEAALYCQLHDSILVSPTTTRVRSIMREKCIKWDIFTGFHSTFTKGDYYSLDGTPLSSVPHEWNGLEPNNKHDVERCISLNADGHLSDVRCNEPRPFMCFTKKEYNICGTSDPEYNYDNRTNKCYKFHKIPKDFYQAHFTCSIEGGHLAIINSVGESKVIQEIFDRYPVDKIKGDVWKQHAFIGFYYADNKKWTTMQGQKIEDAGYAKFAQGEPSNAGEENCGSVDRNGLLNDLKCSLNHAFICEKNLQLPSFCDSTSEKFTSSL